MWQGGGKGCGKGGGKGHGKRHGKGCGKRHGKGCGKVHNTFPQYWPFHIIKRIKCDGGVHSDQVIHTHRYDNICIQIL